MNHFFWVGVSAFLLLILIVIVDIMEAKKRNKRHRHHHHSRYKLKIFFNNQIQFTMSQQITVGQILASHLGVVDHVTGAVVPATFANETVAIADTSLLSVDADENFTGLAAGSTDVTITADCSYTDGNTNQPLTVNKSVTVNLTITAPVSAEETDLVVSFS